jgi:hypothetical protein
MPQPEKPRPIQELELGVDELGVDEVDAAAGAAVGADAGAGVAVSVLVAGALLSDDEDSEAGSLLLAA